MRIGCPKEIKNHEYRVALIPATVGAYVRDGHEVVVERGAGSGSGILDREFEAAGARVVPSAAQVWEMSDMIVKVKEPLPAEYALMKSGQVIYAYFHVAADERLTKECLDRGIIAVAYETVQEDDGLLPLLKPMSEVAGRMAPIVGAYYLGRPHGGCGNLPAGVPGVAPGNVLILGGGTVGSNAARIAAGLGAVVTILDINIDTLEHLGDVMPPNVLPIYGDSYSLEKGLAAAHLVIGAVLIPGAKSPRLITREHLKLMKSGSVFVDVSIDQGGCAETSKPTSHTDPVYTVDGVIHYCVTNMPGAYSRTSTFALNNRTIRYGLKLANEGVQAACKGSAALRRGLNMFKGTVTFKPVAEAFGLESLYKSPEKALGL